jgi:hypothetical protein
MPLSGAVRGQVSGALESGCPCVGVGLWHECLAQGIRAVRNEVDPRTVAQALLAPFLARVATFWEEEKDRPADHVEHLILSDALRFRGVLRMTPGACVVPRREVDRGGRRSRRKAGRAKRRGAR